VAKAELSPDRQGARATVLSLLIGYGAFVAGTVLIPLDSTLGGIIFWAGVFVIFWAGWLSAQK